MKKIAIVLAATGLSATSALAFASNPILGSLKQQGIEAKVLAEAELSDICSKVILGKLTRSRICWMISYIAYLQKKLKIGCFMVFPCLT